jgi:hypothetical protein
VGIPVWAAVHDVHPGGGRRRRTAGSVVWSELDVLIQKIGPWKGASAGVAAPEIGVSALHHRRTRDALMVTATTNLGLDV